MLIEKINVMFYRVSIDARKENLAKDVVEKHELKSCWQVGINAVLALKFVVFYMVALQTW